MQALNGATSAYRRALEVLYQRTTAAGLGTQNNLGTALSDLAEWSEGAAAVQGLKMR